MTEDEEQSGPTGPVELVAFREECRAVEATLRAAATTDPTGPGLGGWTLADLVRHLIGVAGRLDHLEVQEPAAGRAEVDRHRYFEAEPAWSFEEPDPPADEWEARFAEAWRRSARRFEAIGPTALLASPSGTIKALEYLATRVLEVVVHHTDVCSAIDRPRVTTPAAGRITLSLLENLLAGPRPRNFGRTRFILAATGRIAVEDPRFPVLR